jgi:hypothetical protein
MMGFLLSLAALSLVRCFVLLYIVLLCVDFSALIFCVDFLH